MFIFFKINISFFVQKMDRRAVIVVFMKQLSKENDYDNSESNTFYEKFGGLIRMAEQ